MRVAIVSPSLSRLAGGIFEIERSLAKALSALPQVVVSVHGIDDAFTKEDLASWGSIRPEIYRLVGPAAFGYARELRAGLTKSQADIGHLQALWMYPSIAIHRWAVKAHKPYVVTTNGMLDAWAVQNSAWKKKIAAFLYERRNLEAAACLQANTQTEFESIRAFGLRNPIAIIPNGVDLPEPKREVASCGAPKGGSNGTPTSNLESASLSDRTLLFLGRIHPKKGLAELIEGWELSRARLNGWKLKIAGWGSSANKASLRQRVTRLGLSDSVILMGPLFGWAKASALQRASAFILPSHSEGLPMALLEAWAYGKPVLMTQQCNIPEGFSADAAIQIEPNSDSIASGIDRLTRLTSADLDEMGSRGRRLAQEKFAWPQIAAEIKAVYDWVLGNGAKPECVLL
jgi:glycosyltransferase involved in cell wall biosynthesis